MFSKEKLINYDEHNHFNEIKLRRIFPCMSNSLLMICYTAIVVGVSIAMTAHDNYNYPQDHRTRQFITENFSDIAPIKTMLDINLANHGQFLFKNKNTNKLSIDVTQAEHGLTKCEIKAGGLKAITYEHNSYKACNNAAYYFNGILYLAEQKDIAAKKIVAKTPQ